MRILMALVAAALIALAQPAIIEQYTRMIREEGATPQLHVRRGMAWFIAGRVEESLADFNRAAELEPRIAPQLWQRGISLYYVGRYADGAEQFELHQTVNPNDVENGAWHFLCLARAEGLDEARRRTLPIGRDGRIPMREVWALFRGEGTEEDVLQAARAASGEDPLFYARLYLGIYYEAVGDAERARRYILEAAADAPGHYMGSVARVHAQKIYGESRR